MSIWSRIAESRISEAAEAGEFDALPGAGRRLPPETRTGPAEWRMASRILKNAGVAPEEVHLRGELAKLEAQLDRLREDDPERSRITRRLLDQRLRYELLMERRR